MTGWQDSFQPLNASTPPAGWESSFQPLTQQEPQTLSYSDIPQGFQLGGQQQQQSPDYVDDMGKSGAAALSKGVTNAAIDPMGFMLSLPRAVTEGITRPLGAGYEALAEKTGLPELSPGIARELTYPLGGDPDSQQEQVKAAILNKIIPDAVKSETGMNMNYQPQTKPGEYAASVGNALPYVAQGLPAVNAIGMGLGSQAGKDLSSLVTTDPKYQQAASVVGGALGGLAASPVAEKVNDLLKDESTSATNALGLPKGSAADVLPSFTPDQIKEAAENVYNQVTQKGGLMGQQSFDKAIDEAISKGGDQLIKGKVPPGTNHVLDAQQYLADLKGSPTSLADLDKIDDYLRDKAGQAYNSGLSKQGAALTKMRQTLTDASKNANASDITNPDAFEDWKRGDQLWSAYRSAKDIQDIIDNAQKADVPSTAIKNGFKNFVKNSDNKAGLTDEEWDAANYAAKHGILTQSLKTLGSRVSGHIAGLIAGLGEGGIGGGVVGYTLGNAAVAPLGWMANARQAARGQGVIDAISQRPVVQEALNPWYKSAFENKNQNTAQPVASSVPMLALPSPKMVVDRYGVSRFESQNQPLPDEQGVPDWRAANKSDVEYPDTTHLNPDELEKSLNEAFPLADENKNPSQQENVASKTRKARYPVLNLLRQNGGVQIGSNLAAELNNMGINPQTAPGLFKKSGGLGDVDNFPAKEWKLSGAPPQDGNGYVDRNYILDAISNERLGKPVTAQPEPITDPDHWDNYAENHSLLEQERLLSDKEAYNQSLLNEAENERKAFLKTRGDAWEPEATTPPPSLEELENEWQKASSALGETQGRRSVKTVISPPSTQGQIPEGKAVGGGNTNASGRTVTQAQTPPLVLPLAGLGQSQQTYQAPSVQSVTQTPVSYNTTQPDKQPVNTAMRDKLMEAFGKAESNNNPNAKNPNSSASGLMQFTDDTWKQMVKRYGAETGITLSDKNDPKAQQVMAQLYAKDNIARMQPFLNRLPTKGELYQAHVLGADGALRLINAANNTPERQAIMLFPKAVTSANRKLFFNGDIPRTAGEVYQILSNKV